MYPPASPLGLIVYLHVVAGEMVPKNLALAGPDRVAMALAPPLAIVVRVLSRREGMLDLEEVLALEDVLDELFGEVRDETQRRTD